MRRWCVRSGIRTHETVARLWHFQFGRCGSKAVHAEQRSDQAHDRWSMAVYGLPPALASPLASRPRGPRDEARARGELGDRMKPRFGLPVGSCTRVPI